MNITLHYVTAILLLSGSINTFAAPTDFTVTWPDHNNATLSIAWQAGYHGYPYGANFTCPAATPKGSCSTAGCPYTNDALYSQDPTGQTADLLYFFKFENSAVTNEKYGSQDAFQVAIHDYCNSG